MSDDDVAALKEAALAVARRIPFGRGLEPCWCSEKPMKCRGEPQCHKARFALGYEKCKPESMGADCTLAGSHPQAENGAAMSFGASIQVENGGCKRATQQEPSND